MSRGPTCACCFIVPPHLLRILASGKRVSCDAPEFFAATADATAALSSGRIAGVPIDVVIPDAALAASPIHLFDCENRATLPGTPLETLAAGGSAAATIAATTAQVREFYATVLGRDSVDNRGMAIVSSVNYAQNFHNAFWAGQVMVYGTGDQQVFADFWRAPDVICHEITHGITQHESGLVYRDESGAVNESISDSFAAVFNQWRDGLPANDPKGWLLGAGLLGPAALARNYVCLRDMLSPTSPHCLTTQPSLYPNRDPDGDVHLNSGIPNRAFALFARAVGGNAWDAPIKVWYAACTAQGLAPASTIADFAKATLRAADAWRGPEQAGLSAALRAAWGTVMVPVA